MKVSAWRAIARWIALVVLFNAGLDLCTCDLLCCALPTASPGSPALSSEKTSTEGHTQCVCSDFCICCAPTLIAQAPVVQLSPATPDFSILPTPDPEKPVTAGIDHTPRA